MQREGGMEGQEKGEGGNKSTVNGIRVILAPISGHKNLKRLKKANIYQVQVHTDHLIRNCSMYMT